MAGKDAPRVLSSIFSLALLFGMTGCARSEAPTVTVPTDTSITGPQWDSAPRSSARVFISGHSLVDQPMPDFLSGVAESRGTPMPWNRHYIVGSSIGRRVRGADVSSNGFAGYGEGYNRASENMDVIEELKSGGTVGGPYDALIITEQHVMLEAIVLNDTVRLLRHYHDRFIDGNPKGSTYFYESWLSMDSKDDPSRWIAYERAASPIWQCVATRINASLELEGRTDRIVSIPAGAALAALIDRAVSPQGLESITLKSTRETVDSIVKDTVHLQDLGNYYIALVTYASVFRRNPEGAWYPPSFSETQARALQAFAWRFVSGYYSTYQPMSLQQCRDVLVADFNGHFWRFMRDGYWQEPSLIRRYVRWARRYWTWRQTFKAEDASNPFFMDPAQDRDYWIR
jgi:hypothetical protein